jgi:hypothetical protein
MNLRGGSSYATEEFCIQILQPSDAADLEVSCEDLRLCGGMLILSSFVVTAQEKGAR